MIEKEISILLLLFGTMGGGYASGRSLGKNMFRTTLFFITGVLMVPFALRYTDDSFLRAFGDLCTDLVS